MFILLATLLQTEIETFQLPAGPAEHDFLLTLPLSGSPLETYFCVVAHKSGPGATPTAATFAIARGADAVVQVPAVGFAALGSMPEHGQVSFQTATTDGFSIIRVDHNSMLGSPQVWKLKVSTAAGAPATSFFASVQHTLPLAQVHAFSVLGGGAVYSDTIAGADDVLSAAVADFGIVPSGTSAHRTVRLMNSGTEAITLNSATLPLNPGGFFSVSGLVPGSVLPPNGFLDLDVTYAPTGAPAVHAGTLAVDTVTGPVALAVALTAEAGPALPASSSSGGGGGGGCGLAGLDALAAAALLAAVGRRLRRASSSRP